MAEFLAMGGYAFYVWPAYGAALIIIGFFTVAAITRYRTAQRRLAAIQGKSR